MCFVNVFIGCSALLQTFRDHLEYVGPESPNEWLYIIAPTAGAYHQYASSTGARIKTFSCALAKAAVDPQDDFATHLCHVAVSRMHQPSSSYSLVEQST